MITPPRPTPRVRPQVSVPAPAGGRGLTDAVGAEYGIGEYGISEYGIVVSPHPPPALGHDLPPAAVSGTPRTRPAAALPVPRTRPAAALPLGWAAPAPPVPVGQPPPGRPGPGTAPPLKPPGGR